MTMGACVIFFAGMHTWYMVHGTFDESRLVVLRVGTGERVGFRDCDCVCVCATYNTMDDDDDDDEWMDGWM